MKSPPSSTMIDKDPLTDDVPKDFHRRMAAIIEAVQIGMWAGGVHDLLGYARITLSASNVAYRHW